MAHGYSVVISNSRDPETLAALVNELGPKARAVTPVEAAQDGEIVVLTIPLKNIRSVPVEPLAGKVVIDTNNYYPQRRSILRTVKVHRQWPTSSSTSSVSRAAKRAPRLAEAAAYAFLDCGIFDNGFALAISQISSRAPTWFAGVTRSRVKGNAGARAFPRARISE